MRLGRHAEGLASISEARDFATEHKIYQVAHDAGEALVAGEKSARAEEARKVWTDDPVPEGVAHVVSELGRLREAALSSPPVDEWQ
jgi:hypothetical protein